MENLLSFVWGILVTLGSVAVIGLLWHLWQHYHQPPAPPQPQQPQQQQPQYVEGLDRGGSRVIEAIEKSLSRVQNPKKVEVGPFIIDAWNDHTRVNGPSIKAEA
jgi:hypothetical protein